MIVGSANCRLELNYGIQAEVDMVPLLMQRGYKPKGWLGLILGTKMYYCFFAAAVDTDEEFMQQMDSLCREIGDRGKGSLPEGVPPAPAPVPVPATPPQAVATVDQGFSPSMQMSPGQALGQQTVPGLGGSFAEVAAILKADRAELEARLDAKDAKMERQRKEMEARIEQLTAPAPAAMSDEQVAALQARLEVLHTAKLLTDEELWVFEDIVADYVELKMATPGQLITEQMVTASPADAPASKLHKLVGLSTAMARDQSLARQARRKFLE
jgi:hypothetical protein